ncbi:hypothetical protein FACS1894193_05620 [Bacilli bacterium]|nr:hypothetical protein FACS1894193_05620 [Bacilli bacterium]
MLNFQEELDLSPYSGLYDILVKEDHLLRRLNTLVDFSFILDELKASYCLNDGRNAINPIQMFKYLLLKVIYDLSDRDLVERAFTDLAFKYFLGLAPEDKVIHASSLTKFRRLRLKDEVLLDRLITKSIKIAAQNGLMTSDTIILDATHTKSAYKAKSPLEILRERSKNLRKKVYQFDETLVEKMPAKYTGSELEDEIAYSKKLLQILEQEDKLTKLPNIKESMNLLSETIEDDLEHIKSLVDHDAKIGHKTADTSFFGYKTHLAIDNNRLITAAVVTTGEKADGQYLPELVEKSQANGIQVKTVLGDATFSGKKNLAYTKEKGITLVAKLHPIVSKGSHDENDGFEFNKDAGMMICPTGEIAVRKARQGRKHQTYNQVTTYFFDVAKCQVCAMREGCYKADAKSKTYSISVKSVLHQEQIDFEKTDEFKKLATATVNFYYCYCKKLLLLV